VTTRAKKPIGVWGSYQGGAFEKIEETVTRREAAKLAKEYRSAFGAGWVIVIGVAKPRKNPARRADTKADRKAAQSRPFKGDHRQFRTAAETIAHIAHDVEHAILSERPTLGEMLKASDDIGECAIYADQLDKDLTLEIGRVLGTIIDNPAPLRRRRRRRVRANCLGPIAAMQAGRRPRKNPEIVPLAYDPPMPGVKPPRRLALLAELVELVVTTPNGEQRTIRPKPNTAAMLTNSTGDVLWFVWPTKAKRVPMPPGARREKKIFETWSKHKASVALNFSTGEAAWPYEPLGVVRVVRYRSDKWTGEPTLYEHEFTSRGVKAFGDKVKNPKLIVASIPTFDQRQAVTLVTSRGLVG
jgi:hypothetical protein